MKLLLALLFVLLVTGCEVYESVPVKASALNPYDDAPVFLRMDGVRISPIIPIKDSRGFEFEILVPSSSGSTGPNSEYDVKVERAFSFENAVTGKVFGTRETRCKVGGKLISHFDRQKTSSDEKVYCWAK